MGPWIPPCSLEGRMNSPTAEPFRRPRLPGTYTGHGAAGVTRKGLGERSERRLSGSGLRSSRQVCGYSGLYGQKLYRGGATTLSTRKRQARWVFPEFPCQVFWVCDRGLPRGLGGGTGRHKGLKILCPSRACEFDPRPRHQSMKSSENERIRKGRFFPTVSQPLSNTRPSNLLISDLLRAMHRDHETGNLHLPEKCCATSKW